LDLAVYTNSPRPKAATTPWKQDFAASAIEPMKLTKVKGSNHVLRSRILLPSDSTGVYLCPGDLAKQKISTSVLGIFVAFC
jgi:hypothetical protein